MLALQMLYAVALTVIIVKFGKQTDDVDNSNKELNYPYNVLTPDNFF